MDFAGLLKSCHDIRDALSRIEYNLPQYTPPRQTNYHHIVLIEGLLGAWAKATDKAANRSKKAGGFLIFAQVVSEEARLGISLDQLDTALRKVRRRRKAQRSSSSD